ncbi:hypothetical protein WN71_005650 [Streptomyces mangrovisoli]|uniref:NACHT domain-containing protein n=1 Tax=Streptomyces mangrovisoli TaxID=1428628 RepID=A0A1J4P5C1_9ACTN|nr:hypothetical protein WN71_005650 [Streptomyces mangrovisoli]
MPRAGLLALGTLVPGAAGITYRSAVARHPVLTVGALLVWEALLLGAAFTGKVFGDLEKRWVGRTAEALDRRLLWRASHRVYLRQLRANVQDMETVGIATQGEFVLRMRQVYVDVGLTPQTPHAAAREPYLGTVPGGRTAAGAGRRRSLESVLGDAEQEGAARLFALIGGPGSGKTTLARGTALRLCERQWPSRRGRLPVLLYLRDHARALLAEDPPGLGAVACQATWLREKVPPGWLERQLERGRCLVLLDGLDEVADPAERGRVVAWVEQQRARHPENIFLVTSRPHGYQSKPLTGAEVLQVQRFTPEQVERFLHQWSYAVECRARAETGREVRAIADRQAADLMTRLRTRPALYDLSANPLLLTMTANVHRYRGALPGSRAELYAEMCDVLLHRRAEARGLSDATGLEGRHKRHVVQRLALAMMKGRARDWPLARAARAIQTALREVPGAVTPEVFLDEARKSGLLVEREQGVYGFAHLTLQEYLAAAQLGTSRTGKRSLAATVDDPWWRETILLWAADNDATAIVDACYRSGSIQTLALAFDCVDQARTVAPETRERLESLLTPSGSATDPALRALTAGILATRSLREVVTLDENTVLCANPVSATLYELFVRTEEARGLHHPPAARRTSDGDGPAVGMEGEDAERFVEWLRGVTGDSSHRLPTTAELTGYAHPAAGSHTVWTSDDGGVRLHRTPGVAWPYAADSSLEVRIPAELAEHDLYLCLLSMQQRYRVVIGDWAHAFSRALAPDRPSPPVAQLVPVVALARELARAQEWITDSRPQDATWSVLADRIARLQKCMGPDVDYLPTVHLMQDAGGPRDASFRLNLEELLDDHLGQVVVEAQELGLDPAADTSVVQLTSVLTDCLAQIPAPTEWQFLRPSEESRSLVQALVMNGLVSDAPAPRSASEQLDFALDLGLRYSPTHMRILPTALDALFAGWSPPAKPMDVLPDLTRVAARARQAHSGTGLVPVPENAAAALRGARYAMPGTSRLGLLMGDLTEVLTDLSERRSPMDRRSLALVRFALIAALIEIHEEQPLGTAGVLVHMALQHVAAHHPVTATLPQANQILLIARSEP